MDWTERNSCLRKEMVYAVDSDFLTEDLRPKNKNCNLLIKSFKMPYFIFLCDFLQNGTKLEYELIYSTHQHVSMDCSISHIWLDYQ